MNRNRWPDHAQVLAVIGVALLLFIILLGLFPPPSSAQQNTPTPVIIEVSDSGMAIRDTLLVPLVDPVSRDFVEVAMSRLRATVQPTARPTVTPQPTATLLPTTTPQTLPTAPSGGLQSVSVDGVTILGDGAGNPLSAQITAVPTRVFPTPVPTLPQPTLVPTATPQTISGGGMADGVADSVNLTLNNQTLQIDIGRTIGADLVDTVALPPAGLLQVASDGTLNGTGTSGSPLSVANPYSDIIAYQWARDHIIAAPDTAIRVIEAQLSGGEPVLHIDNINPVIPDPPVVNSSTSRFLRADLAPGTDPVYIWGSTGAPAFSTYHGALYQFVRGASSDGTDGMIREGSNVTFAYDDAGQFMTINSTATGGGTGGHPEIPQAVADNTQTINAPNDDTFYAWSPRTVRGAVNGIVTNTLGFRIDDDDLDEQIPSSESTTNAPSRHATARMGTRLIGRINDNRPAVWAALNNTDLIPMDKLPAGIGGGTTVIAHSEEQVTTNILESLTVDGTSWDVVVPAEQSFNTSTIAGAQTARSVSFDGVNYNFPSGGGEGGSVTPYSRTQVGHVASFNLTVAAISMTEEISDTANYEIVLQSTNSGVQVHAQMVSGAALRGLAAHLDTPTLSTNAMNLKIGRLNATTLGDFGHSTVHLWRGNSFTQFYINHGRNEPLRVYFFKIIGATGEGSGGGGTGDDAYDWATVGNFDTIPDNKLAATITRDSELATVATTGAYSDITNPPGVVSGADLSITGQTLRIDIDRTSGPTFTDTVTLPGGAADGVVTGGTIEGVAGVMALTLQRSVGADVTISGTYEAGSGGGGDDAFDWATVGNTDTIPTAKIPVLGEGNIGTDAVGHDELKPGAVRASELENGVHNVVTSALTGVELENNFIRFQQSQELTNNVISSRNVDIAVATLDINGLIDPGVVPAGIGGGISESDADARYVRKTGGMLQVVENSFEVNALISGERTNANGDAANSENLYFLNDTITDGQAMRFAVNAGGNNTHLGRWILFEESGGTDRLSIMARADDSDRDGIKPGFDFDRGANGLFVDDVTGRPLTVQGNFHIKGDLTVDGDTPGGGTPIELAAGATTTNEVAALALGAATWTPVSEFDDADIYINESGWTRQTIDGRDYLRVPSGAAGVYEVTASLSISSTLNDRLSVRMRLRHLRGSTVLATYSMSQNYWRSNSTIPAQLLGLTVAELLDLEAGDDIGLEIWGHRAATVTVAVDGFISAVRQGGTQGVPGPAGGGLTQEQADNRYARQDSLGTASTRDDAYFLTSDGGVLTGDLTVQADIEVNDNVTLGVAANDTIFLNGTPDILDTVADDWRSELALGTAAVRDTGTGAGNVPVLDASGKLPASTYDAGTKQNLHMQGSGAVNLTSSWATTLSASLTLPTGTSGTVACWGNARQATNNAGQIRLSSGTQNSYPHSLGNNLSGTIFHMFPGLSAGVNTFNLQGTSSASNARQSNLALMCLEL